MRNREPIPEEGMGEIAFCSKPGQYQLVTRGFLNSVDNALSEDLLASRKSSATAVGCAEIKTET